MAKPESESLSSTDEEQDLRELSERMGHLHVRENRVGAKRTKEPPKGDKNTREEPRQKERKGFERGGARPSLKTQETETGDVVSQDPSRKTNFSQPEWKRPSVASESSETCLPCEDLQEAKAPERGEKGRAEDSFITLC